MHGCVRAGDNFRELVFSIRHLETELRCQPDWQPSLPAEPSLLPLPPVTFGVLSPGSCPPSDSSLLALWCPTPACDLPMTDFPCKGRLPCSLFLSWLVAGSTDLCCGHTLLYVFISMPMPPLPRLRLHVCWRNVSFRLSKNPGSAGWTRKSLSGQMHMNEWDEVDSSLNLRVKIIKMHVKLWPRGIPFVNILIHGYFYVLGSFNWSVFCFWDKLSCISAFWLMIVLRMTLNLWSSHSHHPNIIGVCHYVWFIPCWWSDSRVSCISGKHSINRDTLSPHFGDSVSYRN